MASLSTNAKLALNWTWQLIARLMPKGEFARSVTPASAPRNARVRLEQHAARVRATHRAARVHAEQRAARVRA